MIFRDLSTGCVKTDPASLIAQGYKLVTVSEMAEAKNVTLLNACYIDFWQSTLDSGQVAGYQAYKLQNGILQTVRIHPQTAVIQVIHQRVIRLRK